MGFFSNIKNAVKDVGDFIGIDDSGGINGTLKEKTGITLDPTEHLRNPFGTHLREVNKVGEILGLGENFTDNIVDQAGGYLGESSAARNERRANEERAQQHAAVVTAQTPDLQADVLIGSPTSTLATDSGAGNSSAMLNKFNQKLTKQSTALGGVGTQKGFKI
jgi:hypothetical protein